VILAAIFLAFLVGFTVRRGTICLVAATEELLYKKRPKTMIFIIQSMAVALGITVPAILFFPNEVKLAVAHPISVTLLAGAAIYGIGAAVNGGCALGTLNHFANGNSNFLGTVIGFALGMVFYLKVEYFQITKAYASIENDHANTLILTPILLMVWLFIIWRSKRFFEKKETTLRKKFHHFISYTAARDFITVSGLGIGSGMLYLILGHAWDYTFLITSVAESFLNVNEKTGSLFVGSLTVIGLVIGVIVATLLSRSFAFKEINRKSFSIKLIGGACMGLGAGLIPGGNDTLILYDLIGLGTHAPVAIFIMMLGIAIVLQLKKVMV
jgi:hypothetical protein